MSLRAPQAPRRDHPPARAARARGQPLRPAALRGRPAADALLAGRRRTSSSTSGMFSKILSPGVRLGWSVGPRPVLEKMNVGKQAADLCSSSLTQFFVAAYFASGRWQDYVHSLKEIYRRRRDVMLDSLAECFGPRVPLDASAGRPVHLGDAARLHRHDGPPRARARPARRVRAGPRGVHGRPRRQLHAAELLGRRRGRHPRGRAPHRRGRARADRALRHADRQPRDRAAARPVPAALDEELANVLHLPAPERRRRDDAQERRRPGRQDRE